MKTRFFSSMRFRLLLLVLISTLPVFAWGAEPTTGHDGQGMVLILNSYHPGYTWSDDEQAGIIDVIREKDKNLLIVIEYLDLLRLPDGKHLAELKQLFRRKYQNQKFSAVIAMDNPALDFAIDNQAGLFRNAPIVFCGINNYTPSMLKGHTDVTGIVETIDHASTIELMLRLHPKTREILVIHDYSVTSLEARKEIEALAPRFAAQVRLRFIGRVSMDEALKELEGLPNDSLVLLKVFITDKIGHTYRLDQVVRLVTKHSPVPVYSTHEQRLGFGIVGGKLLSARHHGVDAGRIALRVLAGEKASAIPVVFESHSQFMFDYKVMKRFGIPLSALPEGSIVINKPVSFYAAHRAVIQTALGIIGILIMVISMLTTIIIQRRRSVIALRASEAKYYDLYENAPDMYLSVDATTATIVECNNTLARTIGCAKEEMVGRSIFDMYHPDCKEYVKRLFQQFLTIGKVRDAELKIMRKDGSIIDVSLNTSAVRDKDGNITHSRSIWRDITEGKRAGEDLWASREQLRALAARLQQVREESRIAIAREIHDELGGGLTGLKMDLSWLLQGIRDGKTSEEQVSLLMNRIRTSSELVDQMIHVVRRIATELRPSILDDLGLVAALEWQLEEFKGRTEIPFEFTTTLEDVTLEQDTATAVFRIFQEALTNVARHSKATKVAVRLREEDGALFLEIMDNGRGITNSELLDTTSLGLLGMRERALVFGGELWIAGEPGKGTTVLLKIPLRQGETP